MKDARKIVFKAWENSVAYGLSEDPGFREERFSKVAEQLEKAKDLFEDLKAFRTMRSAPENEKEAAERRNSREWKVADSAFKMLDKLGYLRMFKAFSKCLDAIEDGASPENVVETVKDVVRENFTKEITESDEVPGMPGWKLSALKDDLLGWIRERIEDYQLDIEVLDIAVFGSRSRGDHRPDSDLDCIVYYKGTRPDGKYAREDHIWNMLNDSPGCEIDGVSVDFWPTRDEESGSLDDVLVRSGEYDSIQKALKEDEELDEGLGKYLRTAAMAAAMTAPWAFGATSGSRAATPNRPETVEVSAKKSLSDAQIKNILARTLYAEAKSEGERGIRAVMTVISNRTGGDKRYVKAVLQEPDQFSCWRSQDWSKIDYTKEPGDIGTNSGNMQIWKTCQSIAQEFLDGEFEPLDGKRWNVYMNPEKASEKSKKAWGYKLKERIGKHKFGYLPEHDPKYVIPGTMIPKKKVTGKKALKIQVAKNKPSGKTYTVKGGDSLYSIAKSLKVKTSDLIAWNPQLKDPNVLKIGQILNV